MANIWKLPNPFKKRKEWQMKSNSDWHTQVNPKSRRFMTPDELSMTDTGKESSVEVAVDSTAIKAYTYNPVTKSLYITYVSGDKEYEFPNVPEEYVKKLDEAPSKGQYVATVIRPLFSIAQ